MNTKWGRAAEKRKRRERERNKNIGRRGGGRGNEGEAKRGQSLERKEGSKN